MLCRGWHDGKKVANWDDVMGDVAYAFHFPASELWEMDLEELLFWHKQAVRISKRGRKA